MASMIFNVLKLFVSGRLFRDPWDVVKQWLLGFFTSVTALVILASAGVPLWLTIMIVALGVGALQPYLFKDIKYH
jgi:hypothetical protein